MQTAKSFAQGAEDAADLWDVVTRGDTDPDDTASTSDSATSDSADSSTSDSPDADGGDDDALAARTIEPMIPIPIDGGRGQLRIYRDPAGEDEPIGVRDSVVVRDGETEIEYGVEVVQGRSEVSDLLSRYSPQPTSPGEDTDEPADDGDASETGTGATDPGDDGDTGSRDPKIEVSKGTGYQQMRDHVHEEDRIHGADPFDPGKAPMGGQRVDPRIGDGMSWGGKQPPESIKSTLDAKGPPPAGEGETPGVYEGEDEGPDPTDAGKDASPTGVWRDMTDFVPDDSPVNRQAWDMMRGGGRSSDPAGAGGQGSGTDSGGAAGGDSGSGPLGGSGSGTSSTVRTVEGWDPGQNPTTPPGGSDPRRNQQQLGWCVGIGYRGRTQSDRAGSR